MLRQRTVLLNSSGTAANVTDLPGGAVRNVFSFSMRRWRKQLTRLGLIGTIVVTSAAAGSVTDAIAGDEAKAAMQTQIGRVQPGAKAISLPVPACGETTQKFGSNDPNDPVDGAVNKTITDWLAAGNKAAWKSWIGALLPTQSPKSTPPVTGRISS
ncbi:hypothetical protein [Bradyrhizobium cosmicum]|uniref:hypothetical protein n=1 Tax=Bradyrhizobium cosmicum TaxID=1404864 RepID=UPI0028E9AFE9|nr:hypothetical protein [Bradyrhizobium cosmicum]